MSNRTYTIVSWLFLAVGSVLGLLTALAAAGLGQASPMLWPGELLWSSFHLAGFYLPAFLILHGSGVWHRPPSLRRSLHLVLGSIPALCLALCLRLLFTDVSTSPLPDWFVQHFGLHGGIVAAAALAILSFAVIVLAPLVFAAPKAAHPAGTADDRAAADPAVVQAEAEAVQTFRQGIAGLLESRVQEREQVSYPSLDEFGDDPEAPLAPLAPVAAKVLEQAPPEQVQLNAPEADPPEVTPIFLGQDGRISDYPPPVERWSTAVADEDLSAAGLPLVEDNAPVNVPVEPEVANVELVPDERAPVEAPLAPAIVPEQEAEPEQELAPPPASVFPLSATLARQAHAAVDAMEGDPAMAAETSLAVDALDAIPPTLRAGYAYAGEREAPKVTLIKKDRPAVPEEENIDAETDDYNPEGDYTADTPAAEEEADVDVSLLPPMPEHVSSSPKSYKVPIAGILDEPENRQYWLIDEATTRSANVLKNTLEEFGIQAEVTGIRKGPVITMFEILPAPGVKLTRITNLADNIALRLAAQSVRIVAPIPGKHAVGIEIPNRDRSKVSFAELLAADAFADPKVEIPIAIGKDITGDAKVIDLARTPHLLIAGSTGSGKSVCVNALISSILYRRSPAEVNLILVDPKIVELKFYNDIPHLLTPVITDPKKAFQALQWCLYEMERRYSLLDAMQVRDIKSFNKKIKARNIATPHMPYLVIVIDEFADLMATSGKELEATLARLAAMSRAVGIHLVLATQRPSTDVITGLIKANIPSRIAFMVASKIDSRIIIDSQGAENLLGKGDMLFTSAWDPFPIRMQGAFLSDEEVERVVAHVKTLGKPDYIDDEIFFDAEDDSESDGESEFEGGEDPLMKSAIEIVVSAKKASASYLQRRLKIGYNRAARLVEQMEEMGIVGPANGSKPREILRMFQ